MLWSCRPVLETYLGALMPAFRHIAAAAAIIIILGVAAGEILAVEKVEQDAPRLLPEATQEGPFGGPPPMKRGKRGSKCRTVHGVCTIDPPRPIGSTCSCQRTDGPPAKGKVE
jgi:hypothetical protein